MGVRSLARILVSKPAQKREGALISLWQPQPFTSAANATAVLPFREIRSRVSSGRLLETVKYAIAAAGNLIKRISSDVLS